MDIQITKLDGTSYTFSDYNINATDFIVESIEMQDIYSDTDGIHGRSFDGSKYVKRKIYVPSFFIAKNNVDYSIQRDLLFHLIQSTKPFYIREMRKPYKNNYKFKDTIAADYQVVGDNGMPIIEGYQDEFVTAKRYLVKLSNVIKPSQTYFKGNVELEFETAELPFAESIGTSLQLEKRQFDDLFSADMNIDYENEEKYKYTFNNIRSGRIFYYGNVPITQYNMYSVVSIVIGEQTENFVWSLSASKKMTITDIRLNPNDLIVYNGTMITRNGIPIIENVNLQLPKFNHGFNDFKINQTVKMIQFDMRFYDK